MALLNPVYAFIVPFLFVVTVPLALLAGITTTLAFAVLIFRVVLVYIDIVFSLIPQAFAGLRSHGQLFAHESRVPADFAISMTGSSRDGSSFFALHQQSLYQRRRRRRGSSAVSLLSSGGSITPVGPVGDFGLGLIPSVGADRDYEGVGGWRSGDDDNVWTAINSRMELPDRGFTRHHCRTPSGGRPTTPGEGGVLMMKTRRRSPESKAVASSPNSSRVRTPSASRLLHSLTTIGNSDSYFPVAISPKSNKKVVI
ncbi:hypothetical protein AAL_05151 [Moelleriella libera RCEF 2490]|uniref:Uncharacterized protein n=1 Tax=Moelleriella libera RCEF 2490 TaxID=1081109 RepID=A0A168APQ2_9HYPO|nr:hypothetical protein AAL_05151 [Moelleriella libera RCEF 2490]